jgi:NAD(P)-dependent dehydrogenase (short-subunit alcohol dehydrogenase family)
MNNKPYPVESLIKGQSEIGDVSAKILTDYHQMMSHFFKMQCNQNRMVQEALMFQEKMIATVLNRSGEKMVGQMNVPPDSTRLQALNPIDTKDIHGAIPPVSDTGLESNDEMPARKKNRPEKSVQRMILRAVPESIKENGKQPGLSPGSAVLIFGGDLGLEHPFEKLFPDLTNPVFTIVPGGNTRALGERRYEVDLSSVESIEALRNLINRSVPGIGAIINLTGLTPPYVGTSLLDSFISVPEKKESVSAFEPTEKFTEAEKLQDSKKLFLFLQVFMKDLKKSAQTKAAWLINISFMDGQFGLKKDGRFSLGQAGCVGLVKALAREYPSVRVKCIDVDPLADPLNVISWVRQEFDNVFDGELEIGLDGKERWKIDLLEDVAKDPVNLSPQLDSRSVILATGGSYGIVSEILQELAIRYGSIIIILGRSPLPEAESAETEALQTFKDLQNFFIQKMKKENSPVSPGVVLKQAKKILKARQIRQNLSLMNKTAAAVEYHAMDVRDTEKFESLINDIYNRWGRIDGVIHGAGVIEDKLIEMKCPEAFSRVFDTKVLPAMVLEKTLRADALKFMVFFSSIVSRFGNIGQTDYCAANETLNKLAGRLHCKWPGRIVSINWGPWDYGMITDDLRKFFLERGLETIPVKEGVKKFFDELNLYGNPESEVLISGRIDLQLLYQQYSRFHG